MNIENIILSSLVFDEKYSRKVVPFLKEEYFTSSENKLLFKLINIYVNKYNNFPTKEILLINLEDTNGINDIIRKAAKEEIRKLEKTENNIEWKTDSTERWCQERSIYNAIMESIQILDDKTGNKSKGSIPQLLSDALSVSFDTHIGHDFLEDYLQRYEYYHIKEYKIPFDLKFLNIITAGGVSKKTLNIIMSGTGGGKSLFMCHCAAANLLEGLNVLYITLEMAEERIAERIDANMLDVTVDHLKEISKEDYEKKIVNLKKKTKGKLVIKEYPTSCAGSANFRHLLNELKIKKKFIPDVIYVDYLNICVSSRLKNSSNINSYTYIKAIAEELRGLAVEFNVPIFSATQTTRSGYSNSDLDISDTAESFGLPATADFMIALISTDELTDLGQIMVKQLKNRYNDPNINKRFVVGINRSKMKLFDAEDSAQDDILEGPSAFDNSKFGDEDSERNKPKKKYDKNSFSGFK